MTREATGRAAASITLVLVAAMLGLLLQSGSASAYWPSTGSGIGGVSTATLTPATAVTVPTSSRSTVAISWTASTGSLVPTGYYVTRTGGTTTAACNSGPTQLITTTSCSDNAVPDGTHRYVVTAVYRSWTAASTASPAVLVATPVSLVFTAQPTSTGAGSVIAPAVAVELRTAGGTTAPLAGVTISVALGHGTGTLSGTLTAATDANGTATFANLSITTAGAGKTLSVSSSGLTGTESAPFAILAGTSSTLTITSAPFAGPASATATLGPITVQARDQYGNPVSAPVGGTAITLTSSSPTGRFAATSGGTATDTVTIPAGTSTATPYYGDTTAGTPTLTFSRAGTTSASQTATITPAATSTVLLTSTAPSGSASATATLGPITVEIRDAYGNPSPAPTGGTAITLTSSSPTGRFAATSGGTGTATGTVTIAFGASTATFYYGDTTAGTPTLTASGTGITSATQTATISAAASIFVVTTTARTGQASGTATIGPITVQARDALGNPVLSPVGGTAITVNSSSLTGVFATTSGGTATTTVTIPAGTSTATLYYGDTTAGTPTLTFSKTGITSATQTATIAAAATSTVLFTSSAKSGAASATATLGPITLQIRDAYGNPSPAPSGGTAIALSGSPTGVFATTSGGSAIGTVTIAAGASTATVYYGDTTAGTSTLTLGGSGITGATQPATITAAAASKLAFVGQPTSTKKDRSINPAVTVWIEDQFGNLTGSTASVQITIGTNPGGGTLAAGTTTNNAIAGVATFSSLSIAQGGSANGTGYTLQATSSGLTAATSALFNITNS